MMRPLRGMVISRDGQTLKVRLESGLTVNWPNDFGLRVNCLVWADYDFTNNKLLRIYPASKGESYVEPVGITLPWPDEDPIIENDPKIDYEWAKYLETTGSGALEPMGDEWGDQMDHDNVEEWL
jgi:hypothetical protein